MGLQMNLEEENRLLKQLLHDLALLLTDLFEVMPSDIKEEENSQQLMIILQKINEYVGNGQSV
jgi:hypothetical protein